MARYLFIMAQVGLPWGGSEPLWSSAAAKLARRGNEVRVSAKDWGEPIPQIEQLRAAGCIVFYRNLPRPGILARQVQKIFPPAPYEVEHVRTLGAETDLVVISQGDNSDGLQWMEAARAADRKYAVIAHSAVVYWWPEDDFAERLAQAYENASACYFVSQAVLELSRRQFATPLRHGKVVRNPFNVRYDAQPRWPDESIDGLALACVGRLDVISKAQDILLQVLSLPDWRERKVCLSLVGKGPHERALRYMADDLKLTNVGFAGQQDNIEDIWAKHHALVLPSRFEGMPLTLVEAMMCGRPCVATDVGGNRELIRDGINGFLAKAPTVELFDEALNRAWERRDQLQEMGCRAAKDVRAWTSPDPGEDFARELEAVVRLTGAN